jgi:uncharacterized protein YjiS (DUF1127 family)
MTRLNELNTELDRMAPAANSSPADTQALIEEGRRLRAVAVTGLFGRGFAAIGRARRRRQTINQLQNLSDRMLEDIGLSRDQIVEVATQLAARPMVAAPRQAEPVAQSFLAKIRRARVRRATIRELEQLPDRVLADIGMSRGQIPNAVDQILKKQSARASAGKSGGSPVHELLSRLEGAVRPLRQWHLSRVAAGQIARLDNATLSDLGYVKGDVDWVPEVMAERKIANTSNRPHAGVA